MKELYSNVITESGKKLLNEKEIKISYDICVEYIKNRKEDGMCPVEKISRDKIESKELLDAIKKFLINNNLINK